MSCRLKLALADLLWLRHIRSGFTVQTSRQSLLQIINSRKTPSPKANQDRVWVGYYEIDIFAYVCIDMLIDIYIYTYELDVLTYVRMYVYIYTYIYICYPPPPPDAPTDLVYLS